MSFIYNDKKLIQELIKAAIPAIPLAGPAAQAAQSALAEQSKQSLEMAKKLVANLQEQLSGNGFSAEREDAQLFTKHLENLNKLVNFLSDNGIEYNSMLISLNVGDQGLMGSKSGSVYYAGLDPKAKEKYAQYLTDNNGKPLYYVYKDGLIAYLKDLLSKGNEILNVMLQKIIDEANQVLRLNIPKELPKQEAPKQEGPGQPGTQNPQTPQAQPALSSQLFSEIMTSLPFHIDNIDLNRINRFFDSYLKLSDQASQERALPIKSSINIARTSIGYVYNNSSSVYRIFSLTNLNHESAALYAKDPKGQYVRPLLNALIQVIFHTHNVVLDLDNAYFQNSDRKVGGNNHDAYKSSVYQQHAIYESNLSKLRDVLNDLDAHAK
tara:strand:- start:8631 stop:9770 length:1140 start_codon:yes stop_codon:yes gene_type:complete